MSPTKEKGLLMYVLVSARIYCKKFKIFNTFLLFSNKMLDSLWCSGYTTHLVHGGPEFDPWLLQSVG